LQGLQRLCEGDILLEICPLKCLSAHWTPTKSSKYLDWLLELDLTIFAWLDVLNIGLKTIQTKEVTAALKSGGLAIPFVTFGHLS